MCFSISSSFETKRSFHPMGNFIFEEYLLIIELQLSIFSDIHLNLRQIMIQTYNQKIQERKSLNFMSHLTIIHCVCDAMCNNHLNHKFDVCKKTKKEIIKNDTSFTTC